MAALFTAVDIAGVSTNPVDRLHRHQLAVPGWPLHQAHHAGCVIFFERVGGFPLTLFFGDP